jgi:hypothetical protein
VVGKGFYYLRHDDFFCSMALSMSPFVYNDLFAKGVRQKGGFVVFPQCQATDYLSGIKYQSLRSVPGFDVRVRGDA